MESSLSIVAAERPVARIAFARLLQMIGWVGLVGLGLLIAAVPVGWSAWSNRLDALAALASIRSLEVGLSTTVVNHEARASAKLPRHDDIPMLLTRIERAAVANGLPWSAGDYRFVPATEHQAAMLEVRCAFKAPYPKVRAMLADAIGSVPALTIREMSFSRQSIDSPDVDAKFVMAIFIADDHGAAAPAER